MASQEQRYPIGIQTFSEIIEKGYVYIDKTDLVYQMANGDSKYGLPIVKIGVNFSSKTRTLDSWAIE